MKVKETSNLPPGVSFDLTPFERAEYNAHTFVASYVFLDNFQDLVEEYLAIEAVLEDLEADRHNSEELDQIYKISKVVMESEMARIEEHFTMASVAWAEKFGIQA